MAANCSGCATICERSQVSRGQAGAVIRLRFRDGQGEPYVPGTAGKGHGARLHHRAARARVVRDRATVRAAPTRATTARASSADPPATRVSARGRSAHRGAAPKACSAVATRRAPAASGAIAMHTPAAEGQCKENSVASAAT